MFSSDTESKTPSLHRRTRILEDEESRLDIERLWTLLDAEPRGVCVCVNMYTRKKRKGKQESLRSTAKEKLAGGTSTQMQQFAKPIGIPPGYSAARAHAIR